MTLTNVPLKIRWLRYLMFGRKVKGNWIHLGTCGGTNTLLVWSPYHKAVKNQIQVEPKVSEVVLIKEDKIPRGVWKLGRIERLSKGENDNIRTATVYLPNGHRVQRAINQLCPLETKNCLQALKKIIDWPVKLVNILNMLGIKDQSGRLPLLQEVESTSY